MTQLLAYYLVLNGFKDEYQFVMSDNKKTKKRIVPSRRNRHRCLSMCKKPPKRTLYFSGNFTHAHYSWWVTMETMMETRHARMPPAFSTRDACSHPTMKRQNGGSATKGNLNQPHAALQRSQPRQWRTGFLIRTRGNYTRGDQLLFSGTFYRTEFGKYGGWESED